MHGGASCPEELKQERECNLKPCVIQGDIDKAAHESQSVSEQMHGARAELKEENVKLEREEHKYATQRHIANNAKLAAESTKAQAAKAKDLALKARKTAQKQDVKVQVLEER